MSEIEKRGLEKAFAWAPEILFVTAGGNANNDATFNEFIPSSIRFPNLITVGAVDKAGDEAPFTSYGPTVVVHANGYEVDSYVPGGERMKFSGTSMASPNVVNLAAKILAANPGLKPAEVIRIIRDTADATEDGRRHLINPVKAFAASQSALAANSSAASHNPRDPIGPERWMREISVCNHSGKRLGKTRDSWSTGGDLHS